MVVLLLFLHLKHLKLNSTKFKKKERILSIKDTYHPRIQKLIILINKITRIKNLLIKILKKREI
jgi:hypothetical protein